MLNPVTPGTATVQADIVNSSLLFETAMSQSQYKLLIQVIPYCSPLSGRKKEFFKRIL